MKNLLVYTISSLLMVFEVTTAVAGTGSAFLNVNILLNTSNPSPHPVNPIRPEAVSAYCVSQTLSEQTQALVRVVCETGQFVSITPVPNKRFLGTHGGAFRYNFAVGDLSSQLPQIHPYGGAGTVTGLRIYNATGTDDLLELLVSF